MRFVARKLFERDYDFEYKKKFILIAMLMFVVALVFFKQYAITLRHTDCLTTKISSRLFDLNTITITTDSLVDTSKIVLLQKKTGHVLYVDGKLKQRLENDYGYCSFILEYDGTPLYEFGHFKYNNWETNDYTFHMTNVRNEIEIAYEVKGQAEKSAWYVTSLQTL